MTTVMIQIQILKNKRRKGWNFQPFSYFSNDIDEEVVMFIAMDNNQKRWNCLEDPSDRRAFYCLACHSPVRLKMARFYGLILLM